MIGSPNSSEPAGPLLSFCIPVHNFGNYIGQTISSIIDQCHGQSEVEIVVLDGGSTDDTPEVLRRLTNMDERVRYIRHDKKGGIDRDLDACVRHACGTYCWLFSGDDILKPGGLAAAFASLQSGHDVYLCEHDQCDIGMHRIGPYPIFNRGDRFDVDLGRADERNAYLSAARNTEALFSFMTGVVVRRSLWLETPCPEQFMGSCWGHVARFLEAARSRLTVAVVGASWVDRRGDNDSFRSSGYVRRLALAIEGYNKLTSHYFGQGSTEQRHVSRMLRGDLPLSAFMLGKVLCQDGTGVDDRHLLERLLQQHYRGTGLPGWLAKGFFHLVPAGLWNVVRRGRQWWRRCSRSSDAGAGT